jgi:acyl-coenzyme A synthetase/AMP-(fatty) acid ligase
MYGMELAGLLPLLAGFAIHAGHPLFPADIAAALSQVPAPRVLVTTPVHLRSLLQSGITLPPVAVTISATAPLSSELARDVESRFGTRLLEMFGSTETCVFATRRTATEPAWTPYPGVHLEPGKDRTLVSAPWLDGSVPLQDVLEVGEDGRFVVVGRNTDLVDVAGKRASLADLTRRIAGLPGVQDVLVLQPDEPDGIGVRRVAALVVAPGMDTAGLLDALRPTLDPAFLPRPLVIVQALPRNAVGKIPRSEALRLLREHAAPPDQPEPR